MTAMELAPATAPTGDVRLQLSAARRSSWRRRVEVANRVTGALRVIWRALGEGPDGQAVTFSLARRCPAIGGHRVYGDVRNLRGDLLAQCGHSDDDLQAALDRAFTWAEKRGAPERPEGWRW